MVEKACSRKYQRTDTDYNSCVYDITADYDAIPSNITIPSSTDLTKFLNNCLPLGKKCFFKFTSKNSIPENQLKIQSGFKISYEKIFKILNVNNLNLPGNATFGEDGNITCNSGDFAVLQTPPLYLMGDNPIVKILTFGSNLTVEIRNFHTNEIIRTTTDFNDIQNYRSVSDTVYGLIKIPSTGFFTQLELYTDETVYEVK